MATAAPAQAAQEWSILPPTEVPVSYALYIYITDPDFPVEAWEAIMEELDFVRPAPPLRWRYADADAGAAAAVDVEVGRVDPASRLAPARAQWCVHIRSSAARGPAEAWRQLAVPYRALAGLAQVEVCDPEPWYGGAPSRFTDAPAFQRHAARIVGHMTEAAALVERGWMSAAGLLLLAGER